MRFFCIRRIDITARDEFLAVQRIRLFAFKCREHVSVIADKRIPGDLFIIDRIPFIQSRRKGNLLAACRNRCVHIPVRHEIRCGQFLSLSCFRPRFRALERRQHRAVIGNDFIVFSFIRIILVTSRHRQRHRLIAYRHLRIESRDVRTDCAIFVQRLCTSSRILTQTGLDIRPVLQIISGPCRCLDLGEIDRVRILIPRRHIHKASRQYVAILLIPAIRTHFEIRFGMTERNDIICHRAVRIRTDRRIFADGDRARLLHVGIRPDSKTI